MKIGARRESALSGDGGGGGGGGGGDGLGGTHARGWRVQHAASEHVAGLGLVPRGSRLGLGFGVAVEIG